jgi:hypothetical protein
VGIAVVLATIIAAIAAVEHGPTPVHPPAGIRLVGQLKEDALKCAEKLVACCTLGDPT